MAAAGPWRGSINGGKRLSLTSRGRHQPASRSRPVGCDQDGPARGCRTKSHNRESYCVMTSNDRRKPDQVDKANPRPTNQFGHIIELIEEGGDHAATRFLWGIFILAGDPKNPEHQAYYQGLQTSTPWLDPTISRLTIADGCGWRRTGCLKL